MLRKSLRPLVAGPPSVVSVLAVSLLLAPGLPAGAGGALQGQATGTPPSAEDPPRLFPDRTSFTPLLAAPREVSFRGGFVVADREGDAPGGDGFSDFEGANIEAEVALGHRVGVLRLRPEGGGPEVTLGFEVGVFTRFFMESPEKDLINADFRVGAPLSARYGGWEGRLTLLHVSSHFGDDFVNRFDPPPGQTTRDGFEFLLGRRLDALAPGLRVYGGGEWNFHVNRGVERTAGRIGAEWDPGPARTRPAATSEGARGAAGSGPGPRTWPYAGADLRVTSREGGPAVTGVGGLALRVRGVTLRLEARGHTGPSPLGKLGFRDEQFLGANLRVEM